jgi:hypothetical protein
MKTSALLHNRAEADCFRSEVGGTWVIGGGIQIIATFYEIAWDRSQQINLVDSPEQEWEEWVFLNDQALPENSLLYLANGGNVP